MSRKKPYADFTPEPEQMACWPDISGNTVNGLGESAERRPTPIYWHEPDTLAHGKVQEWFYQYNQQPELAEPRQRRAEIIAEPLHELAPSPAEMSAREWTELVKCTALDGHAELVGITRLDPDWVFEGFEVPPFANMIVLGVVMDFELINTSPEMPSAAEVVRQYGRGMAAAKAVANVLRARGWDASPHGGPWAGDINAIPAALACGFGELGKNGSIINRHHGCCFRLAHVLTNAPLEYDVIDRFGADDYCMRCQACTRVCPPEAISDDKQLVRGVEKWYVDFDKCVPFFNQTAGCGMCLAICPWSIPGKAPRLIDWLEGQQGAGGSGDGD